MLKVDISLSGERRIKELQSVIADGIVKLAVTDRNARLTALQERQDALRSIVKARAADPNNQSAPGANTGYLVRNVKQIGGGDTAQVVEEFALDTGLFTGVARDREAGRY